MNEIKTMIEALRILSHDIQSGDGVANACVADAANMIESLSEQLAKANERVSRLEKILQRYESEQLQPLKLRVKELEIKSQILLIENDFMRGFILDDYSVNPIWLDEQLEQLRKEQLND